MNRIDDCLRNLSLQTRTALVSFITAGDPNVVATIPCLRALVRGGADILELGIPFSDPEGEGPVIQKSSERAIANGVTLAKTLEIVTEFRRDNQNTPLVLMGYLNTILAMGIAVFTKRAKRAGVDGLILINLPVEESAAIKQALDEEEISLILLVAPTSPRPRMKAVAEASSGFLYYVSLKGITGADHFDATDVGRHVSILKTMTKLPVCIGFGIKDAHTAQMAAESADGVVIGSALVETMARGDALTDIESMLEAQIGAIREALDAKPNH